MRHQAELDLALIRRVMDETRQEVVDRGKHFIIWGLVTAVGLAVTYQAITGPLTVNPATVWVVLLALGWAASLAVGWADSRRARVTTLGRRLLSAVWVATAVTLTLTGLAGMFGDVLDPRALSGVLAAIIAAPILVTALLTGESWLRAVAAAWWLGGGVMLFVPGIYAILLMAAMALLLMALPGVVLYVRSRRPAFTAEPIES